MTEATYIHCTVYSIAEKAYLRGLHLTSRELVFECGWCFHLSFKFMKVNYNILVA